MNLRKITSIATMALGVLLIIGAIGTWAMVSSKLADQRITTPSDACMAERVVRGPFTAYCQAEIINEHALNSTDGKKYAELGRDDPLRNVAMNASFLQASLFTSVLAFGVSAMAFGMGVLFILIGLGIKDVNERLDALSTPVRS